MCVSQKCLECDGTPLKTGECDPRICTVTFGEAYYVKAVPADEYQFDIDAIEGENMTQGTPKRDGSGQGRRANRGRGGCKTTRRQ
jgi:hypothetical protein